MSLKDNSTKAQNWKVAIEGLTDNQEKLDSLWKNYIYQSDRTQSYHVMVYSLIGFFYSNSYNRHKYRLKFFEDLPIILLNDSKTIGQRFFDNAFPNLEDHEYVKKKLREIYSKLTEKQKYFQLMLLMKISNIERLQKCLSLYK